MMWRVFSMKAFPFDGIDQPAKCYPYRMASGVYGWSVVDDDAAKFDSLNSASEFVKFIKSEFPEAEFSIERIP